jgi:hypothetical protein
MFGKKRAAKAAAERREQDSLRHWLPIFERAKRGDEAAQREFWLTSECLLPESLRDQRDEIGDLYRASQRRNDTSRLLEARHSAATEIDEIDALKNLLQYRQQVAEQYQEQLEAELHISWKEIVQHLQTVVESYYQELMAGRQEYEKFNTLWILIERTRKGRDYLGRTRDNDLRAVGVEELDYPDDWNYLLALHRQTPALEAFRDLPNRGAGDVRLLADQAVANNSLTDAQIALAYCNAYAAYRAAVGDVLTAQLARVVNVYQGLAPQGVETREA